MPEKSVQSVASATSKLFKVKGHRLFAIVHARPWVCDECGERYTDVEMMHETMSPCRVSAARVIRGSR